MKSEKKSKLQLVLIVVTLVCIALFVVNGLQKNKENITPPSSSNVGNEEKNAAKTVLEKAKVANPDIVAWLTVPNTDIDNAVMQATDNEYYLRRGETGEKDGWGSYFADYYAELTDPSKLIQNTVIYGHTADNDDPDGEKFSQLFRFTELDFLRKNLTISLFVGSDELSFEIFAIFYTDVDFYYIDPNPTSQGFENFMQEVNAKNEFIFEGMKVSEQDKLLTLSGCARKYDENKTGNHRIVLMAKLVDKDIESSPITIKGNPSPKRP